MDLAQGRPAVVIEAINNQEFSKIQLQKGKEWLSFLEDNFLEKLKVAEKLTKDKISVSKLMEELNGLSLVVRDFLLVSLGQLDLVTYKYLIPELQNPLLKNKLGNAVGFLQNIERAKIQLRQKINSRLVLENLFLK